MKNEYYKDFITFLYENREVMSPKLREAVEDEMARILIDELIDHIAKIIVKENKNDSK